MKKDHIFINIAAYNEEDILDTIDTAFSKADNPDNVHIGIVLQYPEGNFPDLDKYKNIKIIKRHEKVGLGLGVARGLASTLYDEEEYYLQIDGHTVFRKNWDTIAMSNYNKLKEIAEKPIISTYVPYYYRDKVTGQKLTMAKNEDWDGEYIGWTLVPKSHPSSIGMEDKEKYKRFVYGIEALESPGAANANFIGFGYEEHYLISGHFLFTSGSFVKDVKYDPQLAYHEENVIAMLAWTRGYRIFNIKDHVLWTRAMHEIGRDVPKSWKETYLEKDENGICFRDKVVAGTLRNKQILTGQVIGEYGAPSKELLDKYQQALGFDYVEFYKNLDKIVEETGDMYPAAKFLYDLERSLNV